MSEEYREFSFYTNGMEKAAQLALIEQTNSYKPDVSLYNGELDGEDLVQALRDLSPRFPVFLLGYVKGKNSWEYQVESVHGAPWVIRHDFLFLVIVADNNYQGDEERRHSVNVMIGDALRALSNRQLYLEIEEEGEPVQVLLNPGELKETDVELIASLDDLSARAVPFEGYFYYLSPDRRGESVPVTGVGLELENDWEHGAPTLTPGVQISSLGEDL